MSLSKRLVLALFVAVVTVAAPAQDMIGPSGSPDAEPAPVQRGEAPETLAEPEQEPEPEPNATGIREVVGEDDVERPAVGTDGRTESSATDAGADAQPVAPATDSGLATKETVWTDDDARYGARWEQHFNAAEYGAAAEVARAWVSSIERSRDHDPSHLFIPLVRLGRALEWARDSAGSGLAYRRAVEIGETEFGVFDMRLSGALNALGRALFAEERMEEAVSVLMRAKDITHRNLGIYNLRQENIVRSLSESLLAAGEPLQATREQRFLFGANEKAYGSDSVELVPALQRWAKWNVRIGRDAEAREHFRHALKILEDTYGPDDLRLIETLEMVANTYYRAAVSRWPREGARSLERVVDIYAAQSFVDQADLLRAQTRLGDWLMLASRPSEAVEAYGRAISAATEAGMDPATINAVFGYPRPLHGNSRPLNKPLGHRFDDGRPRYIVLQFNVDTRGRARNITVVEDNVGLVSVLVDVRERVHSTSFRPRFDANGNPVKTQGMRYRFELNTDGLAARPEIQTPDQRGESQSAQPVEPGTSTTNRAPQSSE